MREGLVKCSNDHHSYGEPHRRSPHPRPDSRAGTAYERAPDEAIATCDDLLRDGFSDPPKFRVVLADWDASAAGFALFFNNYSTWRGRPGIYLEDLFVRPEFRRRGVGRALLTHLAQLAVNEGCARLEWAVLNWNTPALEFYRSLGATPLDEWTTLRVTGSALSRLAQT